MGFNRKGYFGGYIYIYIFLFWLTNTQSEELTVLFKTSVKFQFLKTLDAKLSFNINFEYQIINDPSFYPFMSSKYLKGSKYNQSLGNPRTHKTIRI